MRRGVATLAELRSGSWLIADVMRYNDLLDDEDESELYSAEKQKMEMQMQRLASSMGRRR